MPLDIPALAQKGVNTVWTLIPSVLTACTLRDRPELGTYDPETDTQPITWGASANLLAFLYDAKNAEDSTIGRSEAVVPMSSEDKIAIIRILDAVDMASLTTKAELIETASGNLWLVTDIATPPGEAIHILKLRR